MSEISVSTLGLNRRHFASSVVEGLYTLSSATKGTIGVKLYVQLVGGAASATSPDVQDPDGTFGEVKFCIQRDNGDLWWNQVRPVETNWQFVALFACLLDGRCIFWKVPRESLIQLIGFGDGHVGTRELKEIRIRGAQIESVLGPYLQSEHRFVP